MLAHEQDFLFPLDELHDVSVISFLQPLEVPLDGSTSLCSVSCSSQFCVSCKSAEDVLCPITLISNDVIYRTGPSTDSWGTVLVNSNNY